MKSLQLRVKMLRFSMREFPIRGKKRRGGAWMTTYRDQYQKNGEDIRPLVSNVCISPPSSPGKFELNDFQLKSPLCS